MREGRNNGAAQTIDSSCPVKFTVDETKTYHVCNNLSLGATLSYNYYEENESLDIAFKASPAASGGWISIPVTNKSAVFESNRGKITIFASWVLDSNHTSVNEVWQVGNSVTNFRPGLHSLAEGDLKSLGTLNLQSGST
ncbi:hypothetical protein SUGI_1143650 [Cryptomeria japonica]|nr:hypothetical protein SUGI_1143650 [Cryptomeria japonica]